MSFVLTLESHLVIDRLINSQNDTVDHLWHVTNGSDRLLLVLFWLVRSDRFQYNRIMPKRRKKNPESTVFLFGMSLGDGIVWTTSNSENDSISWTCTFISNRKGRWKSQTDS
jgi:hypothetical protein